MWMDGWMDGVFLAGPLPATESGSSLGKEQQKDWSRAAQLHTVWHHVPLRCRHSSPRHSQIVLWFVAILRLGL